MGASSDNLSVIELRGVRQNNLKGWDLEVPLRKFVVVTGVSGSGKSSLAFDTLFAEGQRRYIESLSTYIRQFLEKLPKPAVDLVRNIPPSIALEQRNSVLNSRSTVGSQTEILDFLRIIFARIGHTFCIDCGNEVRQVGAEILLEEALKWLPGRKGAIIYPLRAVPITGKPAKKRKSKSAGKAPKKSGKNQVATVAPTDPAMGAGLALRLLKERGFRRAVWMKGGKTAVPLDLEMLGSEDFPAVPDEALTHDQVFAVVDRVKLERKKKGEKPDAETVTRLSDSLEQAVKWSGGERAGFLDLETDELKLFDLRFACTACGREHRRPEPNLFSFNSPLGACPACSGFGHTLDIDENLVVPDPTRTLKNGAIDPLSKPSFSEWQKDFFKFLGNHKISTGTRYQELKPEEREWIWKGDPADDTFPGILAFFTELERKKYKLHVRVFIRRYQSQNLCRVCQGARLQPEALAVKIGRKSLADIVQMPAETSFAWFSELKLSMAEEKIAWDALEQIHRRLFFLCEMGLGYLTLARLTKTLSGGEFQRISLATQLGSGLCGTLYVLDEPSIGLHAADTERLIGILQGLRDAGNSVVVVEHDLEVIRAADWLIELGPGAGRAGGELVASSPAKDLLRNPRSLTGKYLNGELTVGRGHAPRKPFRRAIRITGCRENNLQNLDVEFPLDRLVVVTGVSGSGKSTLVHHTLYSALSKYFARQEGLDFTDSVGRFDRLYGAEQVGGVVLLDQKPIGKSSRSNPATYLKIWEEIRRIYANQALAVRRGYTPQHFSFNVDGGRCPICKGEGEITVEMHFMADVRLVCEECGGKRFKKSVLEVESKGKNVFELLETTVDEVFDLYRSHPVLNRKLGILRDVGLGYLHLGQSGSSLSGGESQRLKIAAALEERSQESLLYIFDEPTTGLHLEDVKKLLGVIQDLVDSRHSVILIEHHLDVIAAADWVIDLGPGGGARGGEIVAAGPPEYLMGEEVAKRSATGRMLRTLGYLKGGEGSTLEKPAGVDL